MNTSTFIRPWHKDITVGADKVSSDINCGQIMTTLTGVSIEAISSQLTCDEFVEFKKPEDVLLALVEQVGVDLVKAHLAAIETEL